VESALKLRRILKDEGFDPWTKVTGGKGLHLTTPLASPTIHDQSHQRARRIVQRLAQTDPQHYVTTANPGKRAGRVFLDYLRNGRGTIAIGPYSPRARERSWAQVERGVRPDAYTMPHHFEQRSAMPDQLSLLEPEALSPEGFQYEPGLLNEQDEQTLVAELERLPFKEFEFHGFSGKRRVVSFGWRYDFNEAKLQEAEPIPEFLLPIRDRSAAFAHLDPSTLEHVLVTEYSPGAAIGWHKDRPMFADVIGVSLLSSCSFRFRKKEGTRWQRRSVRLAPRSAYLLRGPARTEWEHSIPGVECLRYSITFRNFKAR